MGKIDVARVYTGWGVFASLIPFAVDMGYEVYLSMLTEVVAL